MRRLLVVAILFAGHAASPAAAQRVLGIADIAEVVSAQRRSIHNLQVSVRQRSTSPMAGSVVSSHHHVVVDQGRCLVERVMQWDADSFFVASAWDLDHGLSYAKKQRIARLTANPDLQVLTTKGTGFFDLMMWHPPIDGRSAAVDGADLMAHLCEPSDRASPWTCAAWRHSVPPAGGLPR